jgi:hypothetical protein
MRIKTFVLFGGRAIVRDKIWDGWGGQAGRKDIYFG